jgi:hypothetical protein
MEVHFLNTQKDKVEQSLGEVHLEKQLTSENPERVKYTIDGRSPV